MSENLALEKTLWQAADDGIAFEEKTGTLTLLLKEQMQKANQLDEAIIINLKKIGYEL